MIGSERPHMIALQGFVHGTRSYLVVTAVFGLIVAVLDSTALAIMRCAPGRAVGVLAFITNFIPNIGFVIGLVPPALMAMLTGGWQLVQSLIQPRFIGDSVELSRYPGRRRTVPRSLGTAVKHALQGTNGVQAISLSDGPSRHRGTHQRPSRHRHASVK